MIFLTMCKNAVIVLKALVAVVSGNRMGFRSSLTRIFPLLSHSMTFTEHQLCARCHIRCWDTVVTKTRSPPWGALNLSFDEYAKLGLYSKKERKLWEHGIAGDLGMDRAPQPQAKRSGRNQETWKEMRMGVMEKQKEPTFLFLLNNFAGGQRYAKRSGLVIYVILAWLFLF